MDRDSGMHLKFGGNAGSAVDSYLEYKRIVGDDDGGNTFSPEEYEDYIRRITPIRTKNRLYVSWMSPSGMDCKLIGPETLCFCNHRYRQHKTDFERIPSARPIQQPCRERGCPCTSYQYLPLNGTQPVRCTCKHMPEDHDLRAPNACRHAGCHACNGYKPSYTCGCGEAAYKHDLIVETKAERQARGHPVGKDTIYQAMGGITGFSSLMDGYARMDPSGRGQLLSDFSNDPINASDHPFLRGNVETIRAQRRERGRDDDDADLAERMSAMRRPGESEMDYYERRYQERQKQEKVKLKNKPESKPTVIIGRRNFSNGPQGKDDYDSEEEEDPRAARRPVGRPGEKPDYQGGSYLVSKGKKK